MIEPKFTYSDIKFAESEPIFARARQLFHTGCVQDLEQISDGYRATVQGSSPYRVRLSQKRIDYADCTCYMGQNDELCKHVLAVGLAVLYEFEGVTRDGEPTARFAIDSSDAQDHISAGMRYIRSYDGPSRIWFEYQRKLDIGAGMIIEGAAALETTRDNAKYLWRLIVRLSKRLSTGGVDDSNGTVGEVVSVVMRQIADMAAEDASIREWALKNCHDDTGFGFEVDLQSVLDSVGCNSSTPRSK